MSIAIRGLRVKPSYEQLINVAVGDGLEQIKFPNRDSTFFKKWVCIKSIGWGGCKNHGKTTRNGK